MSANTPDDPTRPDTEMDAEIAAAEKDAQAEIDAEIKAEMAAARAAEAAEEASENSDSEDGEESPWNSEQALQAENEDLKDRLIRAVAEMENLRKRTEKEKTDTRKFAISKFAEDLLSVGDTMERAVGTVPDEVRQSSEQIASFIEGIELTQKNLMNVMERHGVQKIEAAGLKFDPNLHQAVMETEDMQLAKGMVIEVAATGYMIGDRVLRPAMVVVSKGPGATASAPNGPEEEADNGSGRPTLSLKSKSDTTSPESFVSEESAADDQQSESTFGANDNPDPDNTGDPA